MALDTVSERTSAPVRTAPVAGASAAARRMARPAPPVFRRTRRRRLDVGGYGVSRSTFAIIALALLGVLVLMASVLYVGNVRERFAAAALDALIVQADALGALIAEPGPSGATVRVGVLPREEIRVASAPDDQPADVGTLIDRNRVERLFAAALEGSETTARVFGVTGRRLTDSRIALEGSGDVTAAPLAPLAPLSAAPDEVSDAEGEEDGNGLALWNLLVQRMAAANLPAEPTPMAEDTPADVLRALEGVRVAATRATPDGDVVVSVATPILSPAGDVIGALQLTSGVQTINALADDYDQSLLLITVVALVATGLGAAVCAVYVSRPVARLVRAAERVKAGGPYVPVKGLRPRTLLGRLNQVLADMTQGLFNRIDAIESFAGEVAHELKNPLTSLRSAVETLPLATKPASRDRLLAIIDHDVRRIDRLISDISEASKLDAELTRRRYANFDVMRLLRAVANAQNELAAARRQRVELAVRGPYSSTLFQVMGNDSRLGQVFTNLIDNGRSFTPDGGTIRITAERFNNFIEIVVDDEGPGIKEEVLERIFERFYTDRTDQQSFGNNSGLGLAISRQIVDAHNGEIFAENRYRTTINRRDIAGARFTVRLPSAA